jgi:hypothetical protein
LFVIFWAMAPLQPLANFSILIFWFNFYKNWCGTSSKDYHFCLNYLHHLTRMPVLLWLLLKPHLNLILLYNVDPISHLYIKKPNKCEWELNKVYQDCWAFNWLERVCWTNEKMKMVRCKICTNIEKEGNFHGAKIGFLHKAFYWISA